MSGRKCRDITISEDSYNQLVSNARRADDARDAAERRVHTVRKQHRDAHREFHCLQDEAQKAYQEGLEALTTGIRDIEDAQSRRLERVRQNVTHQIEQQGERFRDTLEDTVEHAKVSFREALNRQRDEMGQALEHLQDDIRTDRARQRGAAEGQLHDLEKLLDLMRAQRPHAKFAPGELDDLRARVSICRGHLNNGHPQAALAGAQERYFDYQGLQLRIAERQAEWEAYLAETRRLAENAAGATSAAEGAEYTFGQGGNHEKEVKVDAAVDYWSEGALTAFRDRLDGLLARLRTPEELSTDELREVLDELRPMEDELAAIVENAKDRLVQSQVRRNLAASIRASFEGTMWQLHDSTYENQDWRKAVHLKLKNAANEEIVVSIKPAAQGPDARVGASIEVNFYDNFNDEVFRQERLREMNQRMRDEGVETGDFTCLDQGQPGDDAMRDLGRLRATEPRSL